MIPQPDEMTVAALVCEIATFMSELDRGAVEADDVEHRLERHRAVCDELNKRFEQAGAK
jgi:hypothetical protein